MSSPQDNSRYERKADFEKSLNSLLGLIEGITIDGEINDQEIQFLENWMQEHRINELNPPYDKLIPLVAEVISDGVLTKDEMRLIKVTCNSLAAHEYFNTITADIQRLHTMLAGIAADAVVSKAELSGLEAWLAEHSHLENSYPYDEVSNKIAKVLKDNHIDQQEQKELLRLFGEFVAMQDDKTITNPTVNDNSLCEKNPHIDLTGVFCFTGASSRYSRSEFKKVITGLGGIVTEDITTRLNYLVIGNKGQPKWKFGSYGGKIDAAIKLKKNGHPIQIIHEIDLHAAIDAG
ncbi:MAG TPA: NAD-dependent DNA ligase [Rheinheimera sp.]|uniref:BRCT domain-containing protein n=1 Tax=Rheinheimera sp. TaxID=1869214 RepID=UPI000ECA7A16|nr:BRCT domain-containing protein [Rheinheimera sp.]HCU66154.1 NAD-dependent DNA ligase [Rheinheimera sp.]